MERDLKIALVIAALLLTVAGALYAQQSPATVIKLINDIEFVGNTVVSSDDIAEAIPLKSGVLATIGNIEKSRSAILRLYEDRGYLAAIDSSDIVSRLQDTGVLTFPITEIAVGKVRIEGLKRTRESVVENTLTLKRGDVYSLAALNRDADRLNSLRIFESVSATVESIGATGQIAVIWHITEHEKTGYWSFGGSYGKAGGFVGALNYTEENFNGRAQRVRLSASVNSVDTRPSFDFDFFDPLASPSSTFGLSGFNTASFRFGKTLVSSPSSGSYFERRIGGRATVTRSVLNRKTLTISPRFESVHLGNFPTEAMSSSITSADARVAAIASTITSDMRDSSAYPTRGHVWSAGLEPMHANLKSDGSGFVSKLTGTFRRFTPLDDTDASTLGKTPKRPRVLAVRLDAGTSTGTLPFFEQYFLGGAYALRGYTPGRFWGRHYMLSSLEYRQPIGKSFTGVLFGDVGDAWGSEYQFTSSVETSFNQHRGFHPRVGAGVGLFYAGSYGTFGLGFAHGEENRVDLVFGTTF